MLTRGKRTLITLSVLSTLSVGLSGNTAAAEECMSAKANPFREIGRIHNELLDITESHPNFPDLTEQDQRDIAEDFIATYGVDLTVDELFALRDSAMEPGAETFAEAATYLQNATQTQFSKRFWWYVGRLDALLGENADFSSFSVALLSLEKTAYYDTAMRRSERDLILGACAVFYSSTCYWNIVYNDPDSGWYVSTKALPKWLRIGLTAVADAVTFVVADGLTGGAIPVTCGYVAYEASHYAWDNL